MAARPVLKKSATVPSGQSGPLLGQAASGFRQRPAHGPLRQYFACIWIHRAGEMQRQSAVVPDGCADLVFAEGVLHVAGPDRHVRIYSTLPGRVVVGLRFQPGAAAPLLRTSAGQLVEVRRPLECFWGHEARRLGDWLNEAANPEDVAQRLEAVLARRLAHIGPPDQTPLGIFRQLGSRTDGASSVTHRLTRYLGLSERTIRRHCIDAFGFGPKTLDRILRFQRFLDLSRRLPSAEMAWLAASAGYSDQAHLSREARCLAGVTPTMARAQLVARANSQSA